MRDGLIRKDARSKAFINASEQDEKMLNPYKNQKASSWGASHRAGIWEEAFLEQSIVLEQQAANAAEALDFALNAK